jgi:argininosuccinate lyase
MCGDAGRFVHWGATTQDIMDTAVALQVRDALDLIDADIRELRKILAGLALTQLSQLDLVFSDFRCLVEAKAESLQGTGHRKSL